MYAQSKATETKTMVTLPLKLLGDNLGQRHRYLNSQVNLAIAAGQDCFQDIEALSEQTAVDRLFKIDVANRVKNIEYILKNLRDDDLFSPVIDDANCDNLHVFDDLDFEPIQLSRNRKMMKRLVKKKKGLASEYVVISDCSSKSDLQKLFDEFRFVGFDGTLYELKGRLGAATSADRRRDMLLVLVSKTGGHAKNVESLLRLALRLRNEPVHERAAIVRSLVKRARAWCLPNDVWNMMLEYASGLGLDGTPSEAQCREGLHAVVLRQLLTAGECESAVRSAFLDDFSTLEEYKLTANERLEVALGLQHILLSAASDAKPIEAARHLNNLLDMLERYQLPFKAVVSAVAELAYRDWEVACSLLMRLYDARVGRRELIRRDVLSLLNEQDLAGSSRFKLAAALRANMHYARPAPDVLTLGWRKSGLKAVAWHAVRSRPVQLKQIIYKMLKERERHYVRLALVLAQHTDYVADIFSLAAEIRPLAVLRASLIYYRCLGEAGNPCIWDIVKSFMIDVDLTKRKGLSYKLKKVNWVPNAIKPEYCTYLYLALNSSHDRIEILRVLMKLLPAINDILLKTILLRVLKNFNLEIPESYPAIVIRYLMLSKSENELNTRFKEVGKTFLDEIRVYRCRSGDDALRHRFIEKNIKQILTALVYNYAFFDIKYKCCSEVIEKVLTWISFLSKENHFEKYVKIHASILYYKAIRQCIKQKPDIFADPARKLSEGVDIVGFTFGRYIVKEVAELKSKYFDSVIELYRYAFTDFLDEYLTGSNSKRKLISAVIKGMLSKSEGSAARLGVHVLNMCLCDSEESNYVEIKKLIQENKNKEVQMFACAEIFD
ncbi:unnamed protein product [Arctia plantaginis]|uniref:Uncharacterized protein n=1 Tax=Arctia plantaginis TaxID=874455 RepID=A0A8S0ZTZ4_ARCPL|nr:unnamed protein product [Arctia plantaginis]